MGTVQRPGTELVPKSRMVGLGTVAGIVGRTSVVNQAEMRQSFFFFPLEAVKSLFEVGVIF